MRVLLRSRRDGRYIKSPDEWTKSVKDSRDFRHGSDAVRFASQHNLKQCEMLYCFEDPSLDFSIPLHLE